MHSSASEDESSSEVMHSSKRVKHQDCTTQLEHCNDQQLEERDEESKMLPVLTSDLAQSMHTSNSAAINLDSKNYST
jgi:hypothetical protein